MQENSSWYIFFPNSSSLGIEFWGLQSTGCCPRERLPEGKLGHLNGILNWNIYSVSSLPVPYTRWKCFKSSPWFIAKCTPWFSVSEHSQDSECWLRDIFISPWSHEEILSSCNRYPFPKQRHQTEVMLFLCEIPAQLSHFKEYPNQ